VEAIETLIASFRLTERRFENL